MKIYKSVFWAPILFFVSMPTSTEAKINGKVVLGFSQIGAESAWRIADTKSIKEAASKEGVILDFSDALQKQQNQIKAIKSFILKKVDVIAFAPVVVTGWHEVLVQAKAAKIPVIIIDRLIDEKNTDLYDTFIGSDFYEEGRRAAKCLLTHLKSDVGRVNIVELRGTENSAPAIQRKKGFESVIQSHSKLRIIRSENGDFKENLSKELMEKILKEEAANGNKIDALFAHNDNMALGAISAIENANLKPGTDIKIVSVDAIKDAFVAMKAGKLNCTVECSPLLGPQLIKAAIELSNGTHLPKQIITEEEVFPAESAEQKILSREY